MLSPPSPLQFFVLLLLVLLLEVTVTVLFSAYTDKVSPSATGFWGPFASPSDARSLWVTSHLFS